MAENIKTVLLIYIMMASTYPFVITYRKEVMRKIYPANEISWQFAVWYILPVFAFSYGFCWLLSRFL